MQTFIPYPSAGESAKVLDYRRLGKQRVEAMQLITIIEGKAKSKDWANHPAVGLWKDHLDALKLYYNCIIFEWVGRHFKNNMPILPMPTEPVKYPAWFGRDDFHSRHRAALLAKNPEWYSQWGWTEEPKIDYVWR